MLVTKARRLLLLAAAVQLAGCARDVRRGVAQEPPLSARARDSLAARMRAADRQTREQWGGKHYRPQDRALGWTPAGRLVYLHEEEYGEGDVAAYACGRSGVYDTDLRSPPRPVITGIEWCRHEMSDVSLAPDGRTLLGTPLRSDGRMLAADLETGRWRTLARIADAEVERALLAPDGRSFVATLHCAYTMSAAGEHTVPPGCREERDGLYVVSLDDGARTRVGTDRDAALGWMPGSRDLLVDENDTLVRVDVASGARTRLGVPSPAVPSPDGRWFAFVRDPRGGPASIAASSADGSGERVVFRNDVTTTFSNGWGNSVEGFPGFVAWAPDGRSLVFSRIYGNGTTLWRVNLDGSGLAQAAPRLEPGS